MNASGLSRRRFFALTAFAAAGSLSAACGSASSGSAGTAGTGASGAASAASGAGPAQLNLVGFSVFKVASQALASSYAASEEGRGATVKGSFGASGAQSRAVAAGQKADLVVLSLEPDVTSLVKAGLVDASWNSGTTKGIVSRSVVVLVVRKGNPKGIKGWADLVKPGVGIVTPDPGTSGSAKWNLLAAWAQAAGASKDQAAGKAYLESFIKNVVSWNDSGRAATDTFTKGTGDVLLSYENEAIAARAAGVELDYVVPDSTILIENPGAVTTSAGAAAKGFLTFLESTDGQKILGGLGYRSVDDAVKVTDVKGATDPANPYPAVTNLTTVASLGGWTAVNTTFFDKTSGVVTLLRK